MDDFEISTPVYLVDGILESGKTSFLNFTIRQDYFQVDGTTLLISCEEGEEEYDEKDLLKYHTVLETIEEPGGSDSFHSGEPLRKNTARSV